MANLSTLTLSQTTGIDVTEDFELPEYQPEVRRIVGVQCSVTRDNAFLEEKSIEISGCVLYTVVYLTGDGGLSSLPFFTTWEATLPLPENTSVSIDDMHLLCDGENVVCRVTGPRKLTLSARVKVSCLALGETNCSTESGTDTLCRTEEMPTVSMKTCRTTGTVSGETGGGKVITCQGNVQITEVRTTDVGLVVDGEAIVRFLVQGDSGAYVPVRSRMPIHETLPCSAADTTSVTASGICAALTVTEEDGRIRWEMEYDLEGTLCSESRTTITTDGYSTTHEYTPHFQEVQTMYAGRCIRGQVTLTGEKKLTNIENVDSLQFLYGWGKARFEKAERIGDTGEKSMLTGTATCTVCLTGNGDVVTEEVTLPIRYEWDAPILAEQPTCRVHFSVWDVGGHMEGDTLHIHAEVGFDGIVLQSSHIQYLDALTIDETAPLPHARPCITLYTPEPTETLWDVQKRYRTTDVQENGGRYVVRK